MFFIGSSAFSYETVGPQEMPHKTGVRDRQDLEESFRRVTDSARVFIDFGLPALANAAEGHNVMHYVFCHSGIPAGLLKELQESAAKYPFVNFVTLDNFSNFYEPSQGEGYARARLQDDVTATFWLHPRDIVSENFFSTISYYSNPEYAGIDLVLPLESLGWLTENHHLFLSPNYPSVDEYNAIQLSDSVFDTPRTVAPLPPASELASQRPVVMDSSGAGRCHLSLGRTVALWREPSQAEFPWHDTGGEQRAIIRDAFSPLAEVIVFERQFELNFESVNDDVWDAQFPLAIRGFTLDLRLRSELSSMNGIYVSYDLIDNDGQPISPETDIEGIGRSANPEIGHCFTSDTEEGDFRILRHVRTPSGVFCKGLKLTKKTGGELVIDTASISFKLKEGL